MFSCCHHKARKSIFQQQGNQIIRSFKISNDLGEDPSIEMEVQQLSKDINNISTLQKVSRQQKMKKVPQVAKSDNLEKQRNHLDQNQGQEILEKVSEKCSIQEKEKISAFTFSEESINRVDYQNIQAYDNEVDSSDSNKSRIGFSCREQIRFMPVQLIDPEINALNSDATSNSLLSSLDDISSNQNSEYKQDSEYNIDSYHKPSFIFQKFDQNDLYNPYTLRLLRNRRTTINEYSRDDKNQTMDLGQAQQLKKSQYNFSNSSSLYNKNIDQLSEENMDTSRQD
ncbi:UNKNOWN [Stylonychia lemnae]|uniref:Uncharacterized protein n=1 Tax=Stylonychia lemnae TaxID=5949 RepID=A0A078AI57_STYLE|nr:UNKNOWN [Stylonychia lemnae]|eukprot:CDW80488.1 UNKNOWN [Stylonychia lemnae]